MGPGSSVEERIAVLELKVHDHSRDILFLNKAQKEVMDDVHGARMDLDRIFKLINQIRWMFAGALLLALSNKFGLLTVLGKAFGFT